MPNPIQITSPTRSDAILCRPMLEADLPAVLCVQHEAHDPAFHEPAAAFAAKWQASPGTHWVAEQAGQVQAYLVCLPLAPNNLPTLHATHWDAPANPQSLYVHDLAVSPRLRGSGAGTWLMAQARAWAQQHGLQEMGLIAIDGTSDYWRRQGFTPVTSNDTVPQDKLRSYGPKALYMRCAPHLGSAPD